MAIYFAQRLVLKHGEDETWTYTSEHYAPKLINQELQWKIWFNWTGLTFHAQNQGRRLPIKRGTDKMPWTANLYLLLFKEDELVRTWLWLQGGRKRGSRLYGSEGHGINKREFMAFERFNVMVRRDQQERPDVTGLKLNVFAVERDQTPFDAAHAFLSGRYMEWLALDNHQTKKRRAQDDLCDAGYLNFAKRRRLLEDQMRQVDKEETETRRWLTEDAERLEQEAWDALRGQETASA